MEIDPGAAKDKCKQLFPDVLITPTEVTLRTYTGEPMEATGEMQFDVQY